MSPWQAQAFAELLPNIPPYCIYSPFVLLTWEIFIATFLLDANHDVSSPRALVKPPPESPAGDRQGLRKLAMDSIAKHLEIPFCGRTFAVVSAGQNSVHTDLDRIVLAVE